ncbi:MAG: TldD/PmbA family protein [Candidatus Hydrothermarchaeales archaeon]
MQVVDQILKLPARFIDVTVQSSETTTITVKDGVAKDLSSGEVFGIGVRVLDKTWGFASSNSMDQIYEMAERAFMIAKSGDEKIKFSDLGGIKEKVVVKPKIDPADVGIEEKRNRIKEVEGEVKGFKEVVSTSFSYLDSKIKTQYFTSEGTEIESESSKVALFSAVFAKKDGKVQFGSERLGGTGGLEAIADSKSSAKRAAEKAIRLLTAAEPPGGDFDVVLDPYLAGVFIHEALGHATEADHILQDESILKGKLGKGIASNLVTVYDDSTLEGSFGFYSYDSEGVKGEKTTLIEEGVLKSYIHSRETSSRLGQRDTGNARAQSFGHQPIVRMSNTYIKPGDYDFEELFEGIKNGVYLKGSKGGEVDTARGVFQFSAEEGFLIENGKITRPIKDVALSGETLEILKKISSLGKDFKLSIGFCGKAGQAVPVGDGGPHIRTFATVGGTG